MKLKIELESPFTWEDLIGLIHLISEDLDDFEVIGTQIVGSSLVVRVVQKEPDQENQEPEQVEVSTTCPECGGTMWICRDCIEEDVSPCERKVTEGTCWFCGYEHKILCGGSDRKEEERAQAFDRALSEEEIQEIFQSGQDGEQTCTYNVG